MGSQSRRGRDAVTGRRGPGGRWWLLPRRVEVPANRVAAAVLGCVVLGLVPWTVWIGASLPTRYDAREWDVVWTGFDVALIVALAGCAWAALGRRPVLIPGLFVAGTLLACDAWFDVLTSFGARGEAVTLATAFGAELPLSVALLVAGTVLLRRGLEGTPARDDGQAPPPQAGGPLRRWRPAPWSRRGG